MKRVRLITEDEIGGFLGAADSEFERPLNNAIRKIERVLKNENFNNWRHF